MLQTAQPESLAPSEPSTERNREWLMRQLTHIWDAFFPDVPQANRIEIEFGRRWKTRLGMISLSESGRTTYIGINSLLCHPQVPEAVCRVTIAHELVHYAHGFGSPLPRKYCRPHQGNVVSRELVYRGLGHELQQYQHWTAHHWHAFYMAHANGNGGNGRSRSDST